ncbi:LytR/AlgR family response regulator transcription factor [Arsenicicoccus sp. oral taxon 190]|uniref:LytR/AlgR family response regulator transcription factor n=1 Tax=Arsenicicoccus sp. oral taxon 190 TaxID=1658671 RepID=UPI000679F30B|nr:LytTR family DNA-binding domain-containing protein [Arsenicicoccus sp. oral taxon 190]AKT51141.1 LytR family transcriptional regulator [Arsenicicoccus sp. oral taxon 190]
MQTHDDVSGRGRPAGQPAPRLVALVVDDEPPARDELGYLLGRDERIGEVHLAGSGAEALQLLGERAVDVVFCDISMPGLDGLEVARAAAEQDTAPSFVFVTAHDAHAVDAFELQATDYVLKPVREERLAEAVRRVVDSRPAAPATRSPAEEDEVIPVELAGVTTFVRRSAVIYAQAQGDYTRLHTRDSNHLVRIPLSTLEERWSAAGFARIHRSTLVSLRHITQVRNDRGHTTVMLGPLELQVSRRHTRALRDRLGRPGETRRREAP